MEKNSALNQAIIAMGGMRALGRALGISHQTISTWEKVPATRVLAVEALTGVPRSALRPDLYPPNREQGYLRK